MEKAACFQSTLAAFALGWYVGRFGSFIYLFFFLNCNFLLFLLNQIGGPASLLALQEKHGSG